MKKYLVELTPEERAQLVALTRRGACRARKLKRALVLLGADEGATDAVLAARARVHAGTVERIRRRFVEEGLEAALAERPRPGQRPRLGGRQEAYLVALACSAPPAGRKRWTMQLLADKLVALGVVERVSDETVRVALKKGASSPGSASSGASRR
jgi:transposase